MRFSGFRYGHGLLALSAFTLLTGAKAPSQGCAGFGGVVIEEPPPEPPVAPEPGPACEPGFHPETICEGGTGSTGTGGDCFGHEGSDDVAPEGSCHVACVPDSPCGPGHHEVWVCEGSGTTTASTGGGYEGGYGGEGPEPMPPEPAPGGGCYPVCVADSVCPDGSHEEYICDEGGVGGGYGEGGGYSDGGYGGYETDAPTYGGSCYYACVDDACPPGTYPETFCSGSSATGAGGDAPVYEYEESCWTECVDGGTTSGGWGGGSSTGSAGVGGAGAAG